MRDKAYTDLLVPQCSDSREKAPGSDNLYLFLFWGNGIGKESRSCVSMSVGYRGTLWFEHTLPPLKYTFKLGSLWNSTERLWTFKR